MQFSFHGTIMILGTKQHTNVNGLSKLPLERKQRIKEEELTLLACLTFHNWGNYLLHAMKPGQQDVAQPFHLFWRK